MTLPGGTVTFFFSDVEGSTRLATALGDAFATALEAHRRAIRSAFAAHHGIEVSTSGDSFFAVFVSASDAAAAALLTQRSLADLPGTVDHRISVRIGLHTGQAVQVGRDYVGLDVHLAARISDAGHGGQTLMSEATRDALGGSLPAGGVATDLGRHRLKDVGPQRIWQLDGPGLAPDRFPPLRSLEAHPSNLPVAASPLVGRARECAEITALIGRSSVVTVTGAGGIGKSRVALEVARAIVDRFPDGVFHLDMLATPDASTLAAALLEVMNPRGSADTDARAALLERLRSRDLLLVLDTADRVEGLPDLVAAIAATCPRMRVLLTSRSPLHLAAEVEYPLQPLPADQAVELFNVRAQAVRAQSLEDPASRSAVERLVARLDGIPLAIELAAARTRLFSPAVMLDRLEKRLPALGQGARDLPDRQRTLHDTISWSCELLRPAEQATFRDLGAFAGSFDLAALEAVVAPIEGEDVVTLLEVLVDRSLVATADATEGEPRFRLLGPIREFARDVLRGSGLEEAARERHARHWVAFAASRLDQRTQPRLETIREVDLNEADIRAALDWATGARPALALELAGLLGRYWWLRGRVHEGLGWLEPALEAVGTSRDAATASEPIPAQTLARAEFWAGVLLDDAGRQPEAASRLERCLELQRGLGDEVAVARTLNSLGVVARSLGDLDRAEGLFEESIERKQALGDRAGVATSVSNLGVVASDRGQYDDAVRFMAEALEIDRALAGGSEVVAHANLGSALVRAGRRREGLDELRIALPGIIELGDPELVTEMLISLARNALEAPGEPARIGAARLLYAADAIRRREDLPGHPADQREFDELLTRVSARLDAEALAPLRSEAVAIDFDAGISLARSALDEAAAMPR
jgi:predicted ATPase/class 3 adenylate cyclase